MGVVRLSDDLQNAIAHQVSLGRSQSTLAFLEEAVRRLIDDSDVEERELIEVAHAGIADMEAGRYVTVETAEDANALHEQTMQRLRDTLAAAG